MLQFLLFLGAALPIAWLASEFQSRRWIRILLGVGAISIVGLVAYGWAAVLTAFTSNVNYSETTKSLVVAVDDGLTSQDSERVRNELRRFAKDYQPSYESSCIDEVNKFVSRLKEVTDTDD